MSTKPVVSVTTPSGPLISIRDGTALFGFLKWMQNIGQLLNSVFNSSGQLSPDAIPFPTANALGGVTTAGPVAHEWIDSIDGTGTPNLSQPDFSDLSGTAQPSQVPPLSSLSGSVTPAQVPPIQDLNGILTPAQVPPLDYISDLTGDVTASGPGSAVATLANTAVTPGSYTNANVTFDSKGRATAAANGSGGSGTVTTTGSPASGNLTKFSGATSITNGDLAGDVTTSGTLATTIAASAVTLAKIANAAANSVLVGSGASGSGSPYVEVALGTNLSMSGTTLNAVAAGMVNITGLLTPTGATISGGVATATSVASFTLASIPSTFTHLKIILIGQVTSAADVSMQFNADTAAHYDWGFSVLGGSSGTTSNDTSGHTAGLPTSGGTVYPGQVEIIIPFYKTTTFRKSYQGWNTKPNAGQIFLNGGWQNTAAITGITFLSVGTTFTTALATVYGLL